MKHASIVSLVAAGLFAHTNAAGYCGFPEITTWYGDPAPVWIDVYIVDAGPTRVSLSGVSTTAYTHAVLGAMETFNQLSSLHPRLRFAGYLDDDTTVAANVPIGSIVVDNTGAGCEDGWACVGGVGCASPLGSRDAFRVSVLAASCPNADYAVNDFASSFDVQNILTHEFGHALGLQHTDEACHVGYLSGGGDSGIVRSILVSTTGGRRLRRDDIGGMRALWGTDSRTPSVRTSTDGGETFGNLNDLPTGGALTRTPLAGSSSMSPSHPLTVVGWAGQSPTILTGDWSAWDTVQTVEATSTWDGIAVAMGRTAGGTRKIMAAWYANESLTSISGNLRWGVKTYNTGGWTYTSGSTQPSKVVGLGFDDRNRRFVMTTLDMYGRPVVKMLDATNGTVVTTTNFPASHVRSTVGDPACYVDDANQAVCVIPFSDASTSGPCNGWYTIHPEADGSFIVPAPEISCSSRHYGPYTRLVADTRATGSIGYFSNHDVFSSAPIFAAQSTRLIPRDPAGGVDPPSIIAHSESVDWGMGVGAHNRSASPFLKLRVYIAAP
jgi:hypothetical protein